ncbi:MAG: pilus assembly protein PilM, partial [Clostridia bacterium]|nr:pilus assembly protein PilM [Clostridia bacterium]
RGHVASSLGQAMTLIPSEERARTVALADFGYMSTQVVVFSGEGMIYHETLPVGGFHITSDLTYGLDIPLDVAETIKRRHVFGIETGSDELRWVVEKDDRVTRYDNQMVNRVIEARCEEMAEMVQYSLRHCGYRLGDRAPLYVSGGGVIMIRGAQQFLASILNRPVRTITASTAVFSTPNHAALVGACEYLLAYASESAGEGFRGRFSRIFKR